MSFCPCLQRRVLLFSRPKGYVWSRTVLVSTRLLFGRVTFAGSDYEGHAPGTFGGVEGCNWLARPYWIARPPTRASATRARPALPSCPLTSLFEQPSAMPIVQRSAIRAVSRASRMASRVARQNAASLSTAARLAAPSLRSPVVPSIAKAMFVPGTYLLFICS